MPSLKEFDYSLVKAPLTGLLINLDRGLERATEKALSESDAEKERQLNLLHIMMRFTINSYEAAMYLAGDTPADHRRKPNYVLLVPTINRQLLDLLFSLVYMLDDFPKRSFEYQRAAFREMSEENQQFLAHFAKVPEWRRYFGSTKKVLRSFIPRFSITEAEQNNPASIPYWKHPFELKDEKTQSRSYLRYLNKWLYSDTSAQSHLSFAGLLRFSAFLVADLVGGERQQFVQGRAMQQTRFQFLSRTAFITLAIATEINRFCALGNDATTAYLWVLFQEYVPEARELWQLRYRTTES